MAYSKGYKVITDHALGYQSINREKDNGVAIHDAYGAEHEAGRSSVKMFSQVASKVTVGNSLDLPLGTHKSAFIPRAEIVVRFSTKVAYLAGNFLHYTELMSSTGYVKSVQKVSTGQFYVALATTATNLYAEPHALASDTSTYAPSSRYQKLNGGGMYTGIYVSLWKHNGTSFALADYDFSLTLFTS